MSTNSTKRMEDSKQSRYPLLINWFKSRNCKVIVALSGGVDSALVTLAARQALGKENVLAITANYQTLANEELETAKKVAKEIDVIHHLLEYNELDNPNFTKNDSLRCFHCRNELALSFHWPPRRSETARGSVSSRSCRGSANGGTTSRA